MGCEEVKKLREEFDKTLNELHSKVLELEDVAKKMVELDKDFGVLLKAVEEVHGKVDIVSWLVIGLISKKENDWAIYSLLYRIYIWLSCWLHFS